MSRKIELAGPGRHDGQKITLPSETVAVVIIYQESDGALTGDLALDRDWTPDMEALGDVLLQLGHRRHGQT